VNAGTVVGGGRRRFGIGGWQRGKSQSRRRRTGSVGDYTPTYANQASEADDVLVFSEFACLLWILDAGIPMDSSFEGVENFMNNSLA
jgi:hypothetical protein